jgi:hypothetical protein
MKWMIAEGKDVPIGYDGDMLPDLVLILCLPWRWLRVSGL